MLIDDLKEIQDELGLSNCELSSLSGVNKSTIGRIMSGKSSPTLSVLDALCKSMNASIEITRNGEQAE